jgi:hypothetical protein
MKTVLVGALFVLALTATMSGAFAQGFHTNRAWGPAWSAQQQSMRSEYAPNAGAYAPQSPYGLYLDRQYGPNADRTEP